MAEIVLGIGSSHGPLLSTPPEQWDLRAKADKENKSHWYRGRTYDYEGTNRNRVVDDDDDRLVFGGGREQRDERAAERQRVRQVTDRAVAVHQCIELPDNRVESGEGQTGRGGDRSDDERTRAESERPKCSASNDTERSHSTVRVNLPLPLSAAFQYNGRS